MRLSLHVHIAFFTRWRVCISMRTFHLLILNKHCIILCRNCMEKVLRCVSAHRTSLSPSHPLKWISVVPFAAVFAVKCASTPAGEQYYVWGRVAPTRFRTSKTTRKKIHRLLFCCG